MLDFDLPYQNRENKLAWRKVELQKNVKLSEASLKVDPLHPCMDALGRSLVVMAANHGQNKLQLHFERASEEDVLELTKIMKNAFDDETIRFKGDSRGGGPPGYDDGSFLKK
jgi:hypothetical protein